MSRAVMTAIGVPSAAVVALALACRVAHSPSARRTRNSASCTTPAAWNVRRSERLAPSRSSRWMSSIAERPRNWEGW